MAYNQEDYTQGLQQGLDRVTQILNQRAAPQDNFSMQSQGLAMPPNIAQMLLGQSLTTGKPYGDIALNYAEQQRKSQMDDANSMLNVLKQQAALGEARSKSVIDKIQMFTGNDPEGQAMFLSELANSPEDIDPMNSTQVLSKLAAIKRKSGYESPDLALERAKAQTDIDYKRAMINQANVRATNIAIPQTKPMPASAVKMQNEALDIIGTAKNTQADLGSVIDAIDSGKLKLGLASNIAASGRNYLGLSNEETRNYQSFRNTLEKMRNDSLRLNKGVQTEGDAQRAWNEILTNINDPELVKQRLKEVQQINDRAANLKMMEVDQIRQNFGAPPMDYSSYNTKPAILTGNEPQGGKLIGTSGGKKVYELPDGTHVMEQ